MTARTVHMAYGHDGLDIAVPSSATIIEPTYVPGLSDEQAALVSAIRNPIDGPPLSDLAKPGDRVVIVHTDITRATPNDRILPPLLAELESAGVRREDITLLNALGTHRPQTPDELARMLGHAVVANYRCLQHDGNDDANLVALGKTRFGHDVRINRTFAQADVTILTGFIEPHFFAGFSGGPKGILPSIAGAESVLTNHGADMIGHPNATWGVTHTNPIWEEMLEAAQMARPSFLLNVALNRDRQITAIFAGAMLAAHEQGCRFVKAHAMARVAEPFDIVITSNSGYPLDQNLYQTIKGVSAAAQIVRPGGTIIAVAECSDGVPDHGHYGRLLREATSPADALKRIESPGFACLDQWQVQIQARIQQKADVHAHAAGLTDQQITDALLTPCHNVEETLDVLRAKYDNATICVLPEGPLTIPYMA